MRVVLCRYHFGSLSSIPVQTRYFFDRHMEVKKVLADTFFGPPKEGVYSPSVQATLYDMAKAVLDGLYFSPFSLWEMLWEGFTFYALFSLWSLRQFFIFTGFLIFNLSGWRCQIFTFCLSIYQVKIIQSLLRYD